MLVDGTDRFAKRAATWMMKSKLSRKEIAERLGNFPLEFVQKVNDAAVAIREARKPK